MPNPTRASTFADWWQPRYQWEHLLVAVLTGMLVAALIDLALSVV